MAASSNKATGASDGDCTCSGCAAALATPVANPPNTPVSPGPGSTATGAAPGPPASSGVAPALAEAAAATAPVPDATVGGVPGPATAWPLAAAPVDSEAAVT